MIFSLQNNDFMMLYMYIHIYICIRIWIRTYVYTYIHTSMYIQTCMGLYVCTQFPKCPLTLGGCTLQR